MEHDALQPALRTLLRPLVRILLRNGVPFRAFMEHAKKVYVDVAMTELAVEGRKPSLSRASVLTGLTRKDVSRLAEADSGIDPSAEQAYNRAARVISGWVRDRKFHDARGRPASLPVDGKRRSFAALVRIHSGDWHGRGGGGCAHRACRDPGRPRGCASGPVPAGIAEASVEGVVAGFAGLAAFEVAGVPVDASQAELDPPDPTLVANGSLVQVEGPLEAGVILAEKVRIDVVEVELKAARATAGDVNPLAGTIVVAGVAGRLAADAELVDELYGTADFDLWDLEPGDFLALHGSFVGSGELVIGKLERRSTGNVVIRGAVTGFDAGASTVSVLGASVPISLETEIEGDTGQLSLSEFFATVGLGDVVVVVDGDDGDATSIDTADAIELD